jgi:hypothetical protein
VLRLRDKTIGHQVAAEGDQRLHCYIGLEPQATAQIGLAGVFLQLEIDLYDVRLLSELEEITNILRGHVGQRIDELRVELLQAAVADSENVVVAIGDGRPWRPR